MSGLNSGPREKGRGTLLEGKVTYEEQKRVSAAWTLRDRYCRGCSPDQPCDCPDVRELALELGLR